MSYDLRPRNKKVEEIRVGAFSWPMILQETGAGYVIGYGRGKDPASYVYDKRNHGSPASNDGYIVTSSESKMMAQVLRGFVFVQRYVNKEWGSLSEEVRVLEKESEYFRKPWHEERLKEIERYAEFMENSGGFRIY